MKRQVPGLAETAHDSRPEIPVGTLLKMGYVRYLSCS